MNFTFKLQQICYTRQIIALIFTSNLLFFDHGREPSKTTDMQKPSTAGRQAQMSLLQRVYLQRVPGRFSQQRFLQHLLHPQGCHLRDSSRISLKTPTQGGAKKNTLAKNPH
jgi:hypothetical protein